MDALVPAVTRHLDEVEAAQLGEQFLREQAGKHESLVLRRVPQSDDAAQMLPFKGVALMDDYDRMLAAYLLNRDSLNWTRLTLITAPEL
ncbi:hypothetical protein [Burkholderia gladioli]|uniref:hypothetical protein n=1 Tax=Burkholderia gladioli TaxID=28095 RepID=UPI00164108B1|nr:hypothetical protein [Burkholderia gladioli]